METTCNAPPEPITEGMLRAAVVYAALRERELCAQLCEELAADERQHPLCKAMAEACALAIREGR